MSANSLRGCRRQPKQSHEEIASHRLRGARNDDGVN